MSTGVLPSLQMRAIETIIESLSREECDCLSRALRKRHRVLDESWWADSRTTFMARLRADSTLEPYADVLDTLVIDGRPGSGYYIKFYVHTDFWMIEEESTLWIHNDGDRTRVNETREPPASVPERVWRFACAFHKLKPQSTLMNIHFG